MKPSATTEQKVIVTPAEPMAAFHLPVVMGGYATAFLAIAGLAALIYNFLMREVKRDIVDIKHSMKNLKQEVQALDHFRSQDVERIIKLETNLTNLEKGQARIETRLDTMAEDSAEARKEIIDSIRELRKVGIRQP